MTRPHPHRTGPSQPLTLEDIQRTCDVIEGYADLGLFDSALEVMRSLPPEIRIAHDRAEMRRLSPSKKVKKPDDFHPIIRPSSRSVSMDSHA